MTGGLCVHIVILFEPQPMYLCLHLTIFLDWLLAVYCKKTMSRIKVFTVQHSNASASDSYLSGQVNETCLCVFEASRHVQPRGCGVNMTGAYGHV